MAKQHLNVTIDEDVFLHYRVINKSNISGLVNDFLRNMMNVKNESREEQQILYELEEIRQQKEELTQRQMVLSSELSQLKEKQEKEYKQEVERAMFVDETARNSGSMQDMIVDFLK